MPFTPAHPAAVLPLRNLRVLPWSAMVIGSMTPDFHYFFLGRLQINSHSVPGVFLFCLPIGMVSWLLFHVFLKRPLTHLLPRGEIARLWPLASGHQHFTLPILFAAGLAIIVGAFTHLAWDTFTHAGGWGVRAIPALSRSIAVIQGYDFTVFKLLQHGSTICGLTLLAVAYWRWRRDAEPAKSVLSVSPAWQRISLGFLIIVPAVAAFMYARAGATPVTDLGSLRPFLWRFITSGLGFGLVALLGYALIATVAMRQRPAAAD